jgi:sortase A
VSSARLLRIVSTALVTAGAVVLGDVAATLAWKEPLSSLYGALEQDEKEDELEALEGSFPAADGVSKADLRRGARSLERRLERRPGQGEAIGRITIPAIDSDFVMVEGTDPESLQKGPGHYSGTALPGSGTTVAIAGHRTTYLAPFRRIDELESADEIELAMPYATFTYKVAKARVVEPDQVGVVRRRKSERLVLTACHPIYSAARRYVVFADLARVQE